MAFIYAVLDTVAGATTGALVVQRSDAPMIRQFHDALAEPKTPFYSHPGDYNLVCLGEISEDGCAIQSFDAPRVVATGAAWVAAATPQLMQQEG